MTRSPAWTRPAWYAYPAGRLRFLAELRSCGVSAVQTRIDRADRQHRGGFQLEFDLNIAGLPARHVRVVFAGPDRPVCLLRRLQVSPSVQRRIIVHVVSVGR